MSQGYHKGNIFSFSSDEFERPQQNHIAQQSRRDKLRVQQHSFEAAAVVDAIQEEEEDDEEDNETYRPEATANMQLSDMFNFPPPASQQLHLITARQAAATSPAYHHRLIHHQQQQQQRPADRFYDQGHMPPSAAPTSWSSDSLAAASTGIRRFSDNSSAGGVGIHNNQTFLGPPSFGECSNLVGGVMERQLGASLSLSSSELQQLEMTRDQLVISRSEQGDGFFLSSSSNEDQEDDDKLPAAAAQPFLLQQTCDDQQGEAHMMMSYGPVATLNMFRNSLYARAAQELLEEFCSVGRGHVIRGINRGGAGAAAASSINPPPHHDPAAGHNASSSSSKENPPLSSAHRFHNQRKKSKLLSMLDEVERRYNHYCEQMQMVVNSFDSVMGLGAATPYTALAHKAMSRHFRSLKDAIAGQLKQTCELLGDKEGAMQMNGSGGLTKVETPKLRLIDQRLRQQRAFHQLGMMDQDQAWRPQRGLPDRSVTILRAWLFDHFLHPYPSDADKHLLARQTGLSRSQVSNWFINARVRLWKPMVEDMYQKEAKEAQDSQHQNQDHDKTNNHTTVILAAATTTRHLAAPINSHPQPQPVDDHATASARNFSPEPPQNDMYRRPAAMLGASAARFTTAATTAAAAAAAKTGDLSLTLGLRHDGVNPAETGQFGV